MGRSGSPARMTADSSGVMLRPAALHAAATQSARSVEMSTTPTFSKKTRKARPSGVYVSHPQSSWNFLASEVRDVPLSVAP